MARSPSLVPWLPLHALLNLAWGACNPLSLLAAFWFGPHHELSTNIQAWSPAPFLLCGFAVSVALQLLVGMLLVRLNRGKLSPARVAAGIQLAQLPFLPLAYVAWLAFEGLEGNIVGFFVLPGAVLYLLFSVPASLGVITLWVLLSRKRAAAVEPPATSS